MKKLRLLSIFCLAVTQAFAQFSQPGELDTTFNPGTGANDFILSIALQPDGKMLIGGIFTSYNGTTRNRIARLNSEGSLDFGFNPGIGVSGGPNQTVNSISLQPDGKVLIGGEFTNYNGASRNRIARLNQDGSLDASFNPGNGANDLVNSFALQPDGKVLIGGFFTSYNGISRNYITRLNANGSLDATFNPGTGTNNLVYAIALQPDSKVLIGGLFTTYNGASRNRVARLNADGGLDTTFNPGIGANDRVLSLALQSDGKVLIGGFFTSYNGTPRNYIARLNSDGRLDSTFNSGTGANERVLTLALQPNGKVLIGGWFTNYNGASRNRIARLNGDGSLDVDFNPGTGVSGGLIQSVYSFSLQPDGKALCGGEFTSYNGVGRNRIARVLTNTLTLHNQLSEFLKPVQIYPNPFIESVRIVNQKPFQYELYTIEGKLHATGFSSSPELSLHFCMAIRHLYPSHHHRRGGIGQEVGEGVLCGDHEFVK